MDGSSGFTARAHRKPSLSVSRQYAGQMGEYEDPVVVLKMSYPIFESPIIIFITVTIYILTSIYREFISGFVKN